jgi:hypothetical protein
MGRNFAEDLAGMTSLPISEMLAIHLASNHYPPVPVSMVEACLEAISLANQGDSGALVELPEGVTWRGETHAPAYAIVEAHHLEPWLEYDYE